MTDKPYTTEPLPPSRGPLWDAGFEAAREHYAAEIARLRAELERANKRQETGNEELCELLADLQMATGDWATDLGNDALRQRVDDLEQRIIAHFAARDSREGGDE